MRYECNDINEQEYSWKRHTENQKNLGIKNENTKEVLCIKSQFPDIERYISIQAEADIQSMRQVPVTLPNGCLGYKAIIDGKFDIIVVYVALNGTQSVHMVEFTVDFNTFLLLKEEAKGNLRAEIAIEDISIELVDVRCGIVDIVWRVTILGEKACCYGG